MTRYGLVYQCIWCKEFKHRDEFAFQGKSSQGNTTRRRSYCIECSKERKRALYAAKKASVA